MSERDIPVTRSLSVLNLKTEAHAEARKRREIQILVRKDVPVLTSVPRYVPPNPNVEARAKQS
jgi:hypothetical protein